MINGDIFHQAVVNILDKQKKSVGTGFIIADEKIVTCLHVLKKNRYSREDVVYFKFTYSRLTYVATIISDFNSLIDIAVLEPNDLPLENKDIYFKIGNDISYHGSVTSFGFPIGSYSPLYGSATYEHIIESENGTFLQLDNANNISHGFSGAPIVTDNGYVIGVIKGITTTKAQPRLINVAFGIPISIASDEYPKYVQSNEVFQTKLIGRKNELNEYGSLLESNRIVAIYGLPGNGKTTIGKVLYNNSDKQYKHWIVFKKSINDDINILLTELARFLKSVGFPECYTEILDYNNYKEKFDTSVKLNQISNRIINQISNLSVFLTFDDLHIVSDNSDINGFMNKLASECKDNSLLFISRKNVPFINSKKKLKGLSKEDSRDFLANASIILTDSELDLFMEKTKGNAKIAGLLVQHFKEQDVHNYDNAMKGIYGTELIFSYLMKEIISNLNPEERELINYLIVSRKPLNISILRELVPSTTLFETLRKLIIDNIVEVSKNEYSVHDLLRENYYINLQSDEVINIHRKIAYALPVKEVLEKFYHLARGSEYLSALEYVKENFQTCINDGLLSRLKKQLDVTSVWQMKQGERIQHQLLYAQINEAMGDFSDAIISLNNLKIENNVIDDKDKYSLFMALYRCYEKTADYKMALSSINEARRAVEPKSIEHGVLLIHKGFLLCHMEKIRKGIGSCKKGVRILQHKNANLELLADGYNLLGWNNIIKGNYIKAMSCLETAGSFYKDNSRGICLCNIRMARALWQQGNLVRALKHAEKASLIAFSLEDEQLKAFSYRQKALIQWSQGKYDDALNEHEAATRIYRKINDKWGLAASLENEAVVLYESMEMPLAEEKLDEAIAICNSSGITDFKAYALLYKSRIYSYRGNIALGIKYAKEAIAEFIHWGYSSYYLGMSITSLGIAYLSGYHLLKAMICFWGAQFLFKMSNVRLQYYFSKYYYMIAQEKLFPFDFVRRSHTKCKKEIEGFLINEEAENVLGYLAKIRRQYDKQ